jgi:hypothetical protein
VFSYLGVLISVIFGLALAHLLRGLSKLIQIRQTVRIYWVHVLWTFNLLLYVLGLWWGMYWWNNLQEWTTELFLFLTSYSIVVFVMSSLLYPAEFPADMDFEDYYYRNHRWFFGLLTLASVLDIPETLLKGAANLRAVPPQYVLFVPTIITIAAIGTLSRDRRVHALLAVAWLAAMLAYMNFSSLEKLVAR